MKKSKIIGIILSGSLILSMTGGVSMSNIHNKKVESNILLANQVIKNACVINGDKELVLTNENGKIISYISVGEMLEVHSSTSSKSLVTVKETGAKGYISNKNVLNIGSGNINNVAKIDKAGYIINVSSVVNLRQAPNMSAQITQKLKNNTTAHIIGKTNQWYKVSVNGVEGYIFESYVAQSNKVNAELKDNKNNSSTISNDTKVKAQPVVKHEDLKIADNKENKVSEKKIENNNNLNKEDKKEVSSSKKDNSHNIVKHKNNEVSKSSESNSIENNKKEAPHIYWLASPKILKGGYYSNEMLYLYAEPSGLKVVYKGHVDTNKVGTYKVEVIVSNKEGFSDRKTTTVTILPRDMTGQVTSETKDTNGKVLIKKHATQEMPVGSIIKGYTPPTLVGYRVKECYLNGRVADVGEGASEEDVTMTKSGKHLVWIVEKY